jgi:hypothetical integral membrane protein (TIGR02206 family)
VTRVSDGLLLSADHLAALATTAALCVALPALARARPGAWTRHLARALAVTLLAWEVAYRVALLRGSYDPASDLPLQLTDAATVVAALALWSPRPLLFELTYFWGLTAALQAALTPGLETDERFPSFFYWHYFITHCGAVVAALFLAFGERLTPRPGAITRMLLATAAWASVAAAANVVTGGNYMFLRERPDTASLLDYMGPWPWYILSAALLAVALFALLDLPFRARSARSATRHDQPTSSTRTPYSPKAK